MTYEAERTLSIAKRWAYSEKEKELKESGGYGWKNLTKNREDKTKMLKRMYTDNTLEAVFENACDCLYYGYGFAMLNKCGLSDEEALTVWKKAKGYFEKDF